MIKPVRAPARTPPVSNPKPELGPPAEVYRDPFSSIHRITADFGDFTKEYFVNRRGTRVAMLVVQGERVLLVRQYRLLIDGLSWEIPGGKAEPREDPVQAAARECLEEAGTLCRNPRLLLFYQGGLDAISNPTYVFYSTHNEEIAQAYQPDEVVERAWVGFARALEMIAAGEIVDALSIIGVLAYKVFQGGTRPYN